MSAKKRFIGVLLGTALAVGLSLGVDACMHLNYSSGNRVGRVNKFSNKGYVVKTYEGTLALDGQELKEWNFSVDRDGENGKTLEQLTQEVQTALDNKQSVKISYVQPMKKWPWEGETEYSVVNITPITEEQPETK